MMNAQNTNPAQPVNCRMAAAACSLAELIHERYFDENEEFNYIWLNKSPKKVQPRGLEIISLNHRGIKNIGDDTKLSEYIKHVRELDLAWNEIEDWDQVSKLCSLSPRVSTLNLSFNPLNNNVQELFPRLESMSTLILNGTRLSLDAVYKLASSMPLLNELHLSQNEFDIEDPSTSSAQFSSSIDVVHLNSCNLSDWEHVMRILALFPGKKTVFLSENPICALKKGDNHLNPSNHATLVSLGLSKTTINDWDSIDLLELFPALSEVRLTGVPVLDSFSAEERRLFVTARLPKLKILNGSQITDELRETAERFFIRHFHDSEEKPHHYYRLVEKHGFIERLAKVDLTPQFHYKFRIICEEANVDTVIVVNVQKSIAQFMRRLQETTSIAASRMRLFHLHGESRDPMEVRHSQLPVHSLHPADDDRFIVQSKLVRSRKRPEATKSESTD